MLKRIAHSGVRDRETDPKAEAQEQGHAETGRRLCCGRRRGLRHARMKALDVKRIVFPIPVADVAELIGKRFAGAEGRFTPQAIAANVELCSG